jgi:hypothetical protein
LRNARESKQMKCRPNDGTTHQKLSLPRILHRGSALLSPAHRLAKAFLYPDQEQKNLSSLITHGDKLLIRIEVCHSLVMSDILRGMYAPQEALFP